MKYSITIPAYKAKFLNECLESVLSQINDDYEVIILNDCSPEDIKGIVERFSSHKNGNKIRYYENEKNVGAVDVVDNWNKLLELAKGDYVICMGDDDKLHPDCLTQYDRMIDKYPNCDVFHARTMMIDENSEFCDLQEERPEWQSVYSLIWHYTFKEGVQFVGDFLYKTESLRINGGFYKLPLAWCSDCVTSFVAASSKGIVNISDPIFCYRRNRSSITTNSSHVRMKMEATRLYEEWMQSFLQKEPQTIRDKEYWCLIRNNFCDKIRHHEIYMIGDSIRTHFISIFYWLRNYKRYRLSFAQLLFAIGIGLALKFHK